MTSVLPAGLKRHQLLLAAFVPVVVYLLHRSVVALGPLDDAYIHMHVARNLAEGNGPVFNVGERVEVSTSPAWTLCVAALMRLGIPDRLSLELVSVTSGVLACIAAALLGNLLAGSFGAWLAPVLLGTLAGFVAWVGSGMETPLAIASVGLAAYCAVVSRSPRQAALGGVTGALLFFTRPEALVVIPVLALVAALGLDTMRAKLRALVAYGVSFLVPVAGLFLARHAYFGEWLPNTYYAKVNDDTLLRLSRGAGYVARFVAFHPAVCLLALGVVLVSLRALLRTGEARDQAGTVLRLAAITGTYLLGVLWTGGDHFWFTRLALPVLPLVCALAAYAVHLMRARRSWVLAAALALALQWPWSYFGHRSAAVGEFPMFLEYGVGYAAQSAEIGALLAQAPKGTIATTGIGAIAYVSRRRILDLVGLADKHIARSKRIRGGVSGHERGDTDYVLSRAPTLVLGFGWLVQEPLTYPAELDMLAQDGSWVAASQLLQDQRFLARYEARDFVSGERHLRLWVSKPELALGDKP
ncbi:MAG: hypothetical protein QM778_13875 [Myxococcales bacterium]